LIGVKRYKLCFHTGSLSYSYLVNRTPPHRLGHAPTTPVLPMALTLQLLELAATPINIRLRLSRSVRGDLLLYRTGSMCQPHPARDIESPKTELLTRTVQAGDPKSIALAVKELQWLGELQQREWEHAHCSEVTPQSAGGAKRSCMRVKLLVRGPLHKAALAMLLSRALTPVTELEMVCSAGTTLVDVQPVSCWPCLQSLSLSMAASKLDLQCLTGLPSLRCLAIIHGQRGYGAAAGPEELEPHSSSPLELLLNCPPQITALHVQGHLKLSDLDVSPALQLRELLCADNHLSDLDLSACRQMTRLHCYGNDIAHLDLGFMEQLKVLQLSREMRQDVSPDLTLPSGAHMLELALCLEHGADEDAAGLNNMLSRLAGLRRLELIHVEENKWLPLGPSVAGLGITYLCISYATLPDDWRCPGPNTLPHLARLRLSYCGGAKLLDCSNAARLTSLCVEDSYEVERLACGAQLRVLSVCNLLLEGREDSFYYSVLHDLDLAVCSQLRSLECRMQHLTSLHFGACSRLTSLDCSRGHLTSLDLRSCSRLTSLDCSRNALAELDLTACAKLQQLDCSRNKLTHLDLASCSKLQVLRCSFNRLAGLQVGHLTLLESLSSEEQGGHRGRGIAAALEHSTNLAQSRGCSVS
jgi:Leucine-rich repeat (LRR) protein